MGSTNPMVTQLVLIKLMGHKTKSKVLNHGKGLIGRRRIDTDGRDGRNRVEEKRTSRILCIHA